MTLSATIAIASILFGLSNGATIVGLANTRSVGVNPESCEFDLARGVIYVAKNPVPNGNITAPTALGAITTNLTKIAMNKLEYKDIVTGTETSLGIERNGNIVYVNKAASIKGVGSVNAYDVVKKMMINGTDIGANYPANAKPVPNGLCIDPNNKNIIYTTSVGTNFNVIPNILDGSQGVWKVDTTTWKATQILDANTKIEGSSLTPNAQPNGCIIKDNKIYFVETRQDEKDRVITYDMTTKKWMADNIPKGYGVDAIVYDNKGVFYASVWNGFPIPNAGALVSFNINSTDGTISNYKPEVTGLIGPADICISGRLIGVPSFITGTIAIVNLDLTPTTTPKMTTFVTTTAKPMTKTTMMKGTTTKAKPMTNTTMVKGTTTKAPGDNTSSAVYKYYGIALFIAIFSIILS